MNFASSCYVAKIIIFFVDMKQVKPSDHDVYMKNNTCYDILGVGNAKDHDT
jgi:hypothetical protein